MYPLLVPLRARQRVTVIEIKPTPLEFAPRWLSKQQTGSKEEQERIEQLLWHLSRQPCILPQLNHDAKRRGPHQTWLLDFAVSSLLSPSIAPQPLPARLMSICFGSILRIQAPVSSMTCCIVSCHASRCNSVDVTRMLIGGEGKAGL